MQRRTASAGFGRKIDPQADEMQRRREAFLAAERARHVEAVTPHFDGTLGVRSGGGKSVALAYLFWFGCGTISAHRFYLGFPRSALIQASLWFVGWLMVLGGFFIALLAVGAAVIWMIRDAFLLPGLCREANNRARGPDVAAAFA